MGGPRAERRTLSSPASQTTPAAPDKRYSAYTVLAQPAKAEVSADARPSWERNAVQTPTYDMPGPQVFPRPNMTKSLYETVDRVINEMTGAVDSEGYTRTVFDYIDTDPSGPFAQAWLKNLSLQGINTFQPIEGKTRQQGEYGWEEDDTKPGYRPLYIGLRDPYTKYDDPTKRLNPTYLTQSTFMPPDDWVYMNGSWQTPQDMDAAGWAKHPSGEGWINKQALVNQQQNVSDRENEQKMLEYNRQVREREKSKASTISVSPAKRDGVGSGLVSDTKQYQTFGNTKKTAFKTLLGG